MGTRSKYAMVHAFEIAEFIHNTRRIHLSSLESEFYRNRSWDSTYLSDALHVLRCAEVLLDEYGGNGTKDAIIRITPAGVECRGVLKDALSLTGSVADLNGMNPQTVRLAFDKRNRTRHLHLAKAAMESRDSPTKHRIAVT